MALVNAHTMAHTLAFCTPATLLSYPRISRSQAVPWFAAAHAGLSSRIQRGTKIRVIQIGRSVLDSLLGNLSQCHVTFCIDDQSSKRWSEPLPGPVFTSQMIKSCPLQAM